jgi:hypothetical protein
VSIGKPVIFSLSLAGHETPADTPTGNTIRGQIEHLATLNPLCCFGLWNSVATGPGAGDGLMGRKAMC